MKRQSTKLSRLATPLMIVCGLLVSGASVMAGQDSDAENQSADRNRSCSNRTLFGEYGYASEGVFIGNPVLPPRAPFRSVGITHFDGRGNLTWVEHTVINGVPLEVGWTAASGRYTVNSNCTGTAVVDTPNSPVPLNLAFVVVKRGKEVHSVLDSNAISTVFIKVE